MKMEDFNKEMSVGDLIEMVRTQMEIYRLHQKLWALAMKNIKINSKTYRDICRAGKRSRESAFSGRDLLDGLHDRDKTGEIKSAEEYVGRWDYAHFN